jgi:hypothetical protein
MKPTNFQKSVTLWMVWLFCFLNVLVNEPAFVLTNEENLFLYPIAVMALYFSFRAVVFGTKPVKISVSYCGEKPQKKTWQDKVLAWLNS